jgi:hypothetical protein
MTADTTLSVRSPADLIAAVPYLLGFHPTDSLTVVAMQGSRVVFAARHDLPEPGTPEVKARAEALHLAAVVARQAVDGATVIGHGAADRVTPAVLRLGDALDDLRVPILDALRVTDGRYWSYMCDEPGCCPPEGVPCDPATSAIAAAATYAGQVAFPDRESLAAQLGSVDGPVRVAMAAATERAEQRRTELITGVDEVAASRAVRRAGRAAVRDACRRRREGSRLGDDDVAWLGVLLTHLPVRDYAWERTDGADWQVSLWTDVLRRVPPGYVPAPACLLAFAAWRAGQGALASVAVARALEADPAYSMAVLLDEVLRYALPPSAVDDWPVHHESPRRPRRRKRSV